jgi:hypothetical protein
MPFDIGGQIYNTTHADLQDYKNIITRGLVLHLDASALESYPSSGNGWFDISGYNNNTILTNSPIFSSTNGGIFTFNGTNQYAYLGSVSSPPTTNFSIEIIARFTDNGSGVGGRYLMAIGRDIGTNGGMALLAYGFGAVSNHLIFELGSGFGRVSSGIVVSTGTWYHICVTGDGTNTKFYINTILKNTSSQTTGAIAASPGLSVGSYLNSGIPPGASTYWHNGDVGYLNIYNRALSSTEILQNYNIQKTRFGL